MHTRCFTPVALSAQVRSIFTAAHAHARLTPVNLWCFSLDSFLVCFNKQLHGIFFINIVYNFLKLLEHNKDLCRGTPVSNNFFSSVTISVGGSPWLRTVSGSLCSGGVELFSSDAFNFPDKSCSYLPSI